MPTKTVATIGLFSRDASGAIAAMMALAVIPVVLACGMAVDYGNGVRTRSIMQNALDEAVLASVHFHSSERSSDEVAAYVVNQFNKRWSSSQQSTTPHTSVEASSQAITAEASFELPTIFMGIVGKESMSVSVASAVQLGISDAEVVLSLDNTGSMAGSPMADLKEAAKGLIETIYENDGASSKIKVGIVPFSEYVNVGLEYETASWISDTELWSRDSDYCVNATKILYGTDCRMVTETRYNDGVPYDYTYQQCNVVGSEIERVCMQFTEQSRWEGCVGSRRYPLDLRAGVYSPDRVPAVKQSYYIKNGVANKTGDIVNCNSPLTRLTTDKSTLRARLDEMKAVGETYLASGLLWGWRLLSHEPPFADGADVRSTKEKRKIMVIMTDGANTRVPEYDYSVVHNGSDQTKADKISADLCTNIKAAGIEIMVVSFAIPNSKANTMLKACATDASVFFAPQTTSELKRTFAAIGSKLATAKLTQ